MTTTKITPSQLRAKGWSVYAAAKKIGVTRQHLSQVLLLRRRGTPTMIAAAKLPARPIKNYLEPQK